MCTGIIKFAGLANDDGAAADDEYRLDGIIFWHIYSKLLLKICHGLIFFPKRPKIKKNDVLRWYNFGDKEIIFMFYRSGIDPTD